MLPPSWFLWLIGGMGVLVIIMMIMNILGGNPQEQEEAKKVAAALGLGVVTVVATTLAMTFVIKPIIQFVLDLF